MSSLDIDPTASPVTRANARVLLKWRSVNERWSKKVRSSPTWWVVWELTWPLLFLSTVGLWIHSLLSMLVVTPIEFIWQALR